MDCFNKLGLASHPNTVRNMQKKVCVDFDKVATEWKDVVVTCEKKIRLLEEVLNLHSESVKLTMAWKYAQLTFQRGLFRTVQISLRPFIYLVNKCYQKVPLICTKTQIFSLPWILLKGRCCQSSGMFSKTAQLGS